jgi:hypothetical protein
MSGTKTQEIASACETGRQGIIGECGGADSEVMLRTKLRPQTQMINLSTSHRCTLDVRLWLGARGVSSTAAPRLVPFCLLTCPSVDPLAPIVRFLVLENFGKFRSRPRLPKLTLNDFYPRDRDLLPPNPTVQGSPVNSADSSSFRDRVSVHFYMPHCGICQARN